MKLLVLTWQAKRAPLGRVKARNTITSTELKTQMGRMLRTVARGKSLTVTHRRKPLARLIPVAPSATVPANDPIFHLGELAEPMGVLTNAEIDRIVYGA